jgi:hypothetical protein
MYVIIFVSDLWKVSGFLRFPPTIKHRHDMAESGLTLTS